MEATAPDPSLHGLKSYFLGDRPQDNLVSRDPSEVDRHFEDQVDGDGGRQRDPLRGVREHPLREPGHLHAQPEEPGRKVDLPWEARVQVLVPGGHHHHHHHHLVQILVPAAHGHPLHPGRQQVRPSGVQEQGGASDTRLELFLFDNKLLFSC